MSEGRTSIEHTLTIEARALEERLAARDPDFRRLQAIRRFLAELAAAGTGSPGSALQYAAPTREAASINEAAEFLIEEAGEPLAVADIFARLDKYGRRPAGKRPQRLLSNLLSENKNRFQSVPWKGRKRWWLRNRPLPKEG
jgi:hypothetical protein